uniref:Protein kinase domain-containing protein n=1 Tax=Aquila chrysaetos chrysaetos TaxID=223781 RepID=A0A663F3B2_AQUCH
MGAQRSECPSSPSGVLGPTGQGHFGVPITSWRGAAPSHQPRPPCLRSPCCWLGQTAPQMRTDVHSPTTVPDPLEPNPSSAQTALCQTLSLPPSVPQLVLTPPPLWLPLPCFPGSPVVLKLMLKEKTERRAFLREYCIALCLSSHTACLRALPVAFESATHFAFGQELAPAGDLCALLNPGVRGLAEELVKRCASQLAEALDFMHSRALVHRDVKLDNVLLFDHECRRVKLGDFGLTRVQGSAVGAMSGTLPYAPPELCLLQGSDTLELDSSLDVWAFAVLLFCLCTGCFPWAVAASSDPQFEDFSAWQGGVVGRGVPASWRGFSSGALEMLRRLLTLDPDRRSPAIEVQKYLSLPWVMAPSTGEPAPSSSQSPLTSGTGESPGDTGRQDAAGGGDGVPMPPANALAPCR